MICHFKGTLTSQFFEVYAKELAPALKEGVTFILIHLSVHKVKGILKPLTDKGVTILFYLSILQILIKMKTFIRQDKARTTEHLLPTITEVFKPFSHDDSQGWIRSAGYRLP